MTPPPSRRRAPRRWLFKSEPSTYSIDDFAEAGEDMWDGIRNYQARNLLRDEVKVGDEFLFYHSSCKVPAVAGIGAITEAAYPDPTQFDPGERYYDPKSKPDSPRWLCVGVGFRSKAAKPYTLAQMRADPELEGLALLARGNRLSIQPVSEAHFAHIVKQLG